MRAEAGELSIIRKPSKNLSTKPNHPKDTRSHWLVIQNANGVEVATAHHYVCPAGWVTEPDPKTLTVGKIRYVEHPDRLVRNPEERYKHKWQRQTYGAVQKVKCFVCGPVDRVP